MSSRRSWVQHLAESLEHRRTEPGADLADVAKRPVVVGDPHQQRPDLSAPAALAAFPAADHHLLGVPVLRLDPRLAALAGQVHRLAPFGDNTLESAFAARRQRLLPVAVEQRRDLQRRCDLGQRLQNPAGGRRTSCAATTFRPGTARRTREIPSSLAVVLARTATAIWKSSVMCWKDRTCPQGQYGYRFHHSSGQRPAHECRHRGAA